MYFIHNLYLQVFQHCVSNTVVLISKHAFQERLRRKKEKLCDKDIKQEKNCEIFNSVFLDGL